MYRFLTLPSASGDKYLRFSLSRSSCRGNSYLSFIYIASPNNKTVLIDECKQSDKKFCYFFFNSHFIAGTLSNRGPRRTRLMCKAIVQLSLEWIDLEEKMTVLRKILLHASPIVTHDFNKRTTIVIKKCMEYWVIFVENIKYH